MTTQFSTGSIFVWPLMLVASICINCNGKRSEKADNSPSGEPTVEETDQGFTPEDNDKASEPVEINGSFLVDLSCIITNQSDAEAKDTAVACKIVDKRGEKFKGKFENPSASIVLNGSVTDVPGIVTILGSDDSDSFVAVFTGVSPQDALGISLSATLDGENVELQAAFLNGGATVSLADKDLYVSALADLNNSACTKEAPCRSIRRALLFVPDIIGHKITVQIAVGDYAESIKISGKTFRNGGSLMLTGMSMDWDEPALAGLQGDLSQSPVEPVVTISRNSGAGILVSGFKIDSCKNFGIYMEGSEATIGDIHIAECVNLEAASKRSRYAGMIIDNGSKAVLAYGVFKFDSFAFPTYVPNAKCDPNPGPTNVDCKNFTTLGILVKNQSSFSVVGPPPDAITGVMENAIELNPKLESGIIVTLDSILSIRSVNPVKIFIKDTLRAVYIQQRSSFVDFTAADFYPSTAKRLFLTVASASYGIWLDSSDFTAAFADIEIAECRQSCFHALNGSRITIGRDAFSSDFTGGPVGSLALNTVPTVATPSEGHVGFAGIESAITILPTIESLNICHTPTAAKPVFEAGYNSNVLVRIKPEVLATMTSDCAESTLGNVAVDLGKIAVSSAAQSETVCPHGTSFSTCMETEIQ